jgi:hypothetical protein
MTHLPPAVYKRLCGNTLVLHLTLYLIIQDLFPQKHPETPRAKNLPSPWTTNALLKTIKTLHISPPPLRSGSNPLRSNNKHPCARTTNTPAAPPTAARLTKALCNCSKSRALPTTRPFLPSSPKPTSVAQHGHPLPTPTVAEHVSYSSFRFTHSYSPDAHTDPIGPTFSEGVGRSHQ